MIQKLLTTFIALFLIHSAIAQTTSQPNAFVGKRLWSDHQTFNGGSFSDFGEYGSGFELGYLRSMSPHFNFSVPAQLMVINLPEELDNFTTLGVDAMGQFRAYQPGARVIPYLTAGVGGVLEDFENLNFELPVGIGVNIRLGEYAFINTQATFRKSLSGDRDNFQYGIGLGFYIGRNDEEPAEKVARVKDKDQDGIDDKDDDCPDVPGVIAFNGCPDTDQDGITDLDDLCPEEAGPKNTRGCPDADADGFADNRDDCPDEPGSLAGCPDDDSDGLANNKDDCPLEAGSIANRGCPVNDRDADGITDDKDPCPDEAGTINGCPDSDNDGFANNVDRCPNDPAPLSEDGCPIIEKKDREILDYAVQAVQFEFSSATLKSISLPVLDQVKGVLDKYPDYHLNIIGHTDDVGDTSTNEVLSLKRGNSCFLYLKTKGVNPDRMSVSGYGETQPIADNTTEEGRALNRRVEFLVVPGR